jgi:hypothetical protein
MTAGKGASSRPQPTPPRQHWRLLMHNDFYGRSNLFLLHLYCIMRYDCEKRAAHSWPVDVILWAMHSVRYFHFRESSLCLARDTYSVGVSFSILTFTSATASLWSPHLQRACETACAPALPAGGLLIFLFLKGLLFQKSGPLCSLRATIAITISSH